LEDIQAEKVSMEYLLREKLEKLVQNEIEERLRAYRNSNLPAPAGEPSVESRSDTVATLRSSIPPALLSATDDAVSELKTQLAARTDELALARIDAREAREAAHRLQQLFDEVRASSFCARY
jgi:hypothetical protein